MSVWRFHEVLYTGTLPDRMGTTTAPGGGNVGAVEIGVDATPRDFLVTPHGEKAIDLSPDGRWLLLESEETGQNEICVRLFRTSTTTR